MWLVATAVSSADFQDLFRLRWNMLLDRAILVQKKSPHMSQKCILVVYKAVCKVSLTMTVLVFWGLAWRGWPGAFFVRVWTGPVCRSRRAKISGERAGADEPFPFSTPAAPRTSIQTAAKTCLYRSPKWSTFRINFLADVSLQNPACASD